MGSMFSDRISDFPRSFIREILKVTADRSIIYFAGGLPNRELFPAEELKMATSRVFEIFGTDVLQYSNSEGFLGLREMIAKRYREKRNLDIPVENILITNGSQQGLDLLGKVYVNEGDPVVIKEPAYLGAI
jgi:2-aminoadipate transaminase